MPHETETQHLDGRLREALKDRAAAIKQAQEARAEADALVAAAYKVVAKAMGDYHWNRYRTKDEGGVLSYPAVFTSHTWQEARDACLFLTPDDARAALEAMLAEAEKRGEKQGMVRAAEIADTWTGLAAKAQGGTLTGGAIALAIRAEAEE